MEMILIIFILQLIILTLCLLTSNMYKIKQDLKTIITQFKKSLQIMIKNEIDLKSKNDLKIENNNLRIKEKENNNEKIYKGKLIVGKMDVFFYLEKKLVDSFKINSVKTRKTDPFRYLLRVKLIILILFTISLNFVKIIKLLFSGNFWKLGQNSKNIQNHQNRFFINHKNYENSQKNMQKKKKNYILKLRAIKQSKFKIQKKISRIEKLISKKRKFTHLPIILETPIRV